MEKRQVNQEEIAAVCHCAPAILLYPSTPAFAIRPHFFPECTFCVCLLPGLFTENCRPDILGRKSKDWTHSMQGTLPHRGFYVINLHDLKGSSSVVPAD
jgi:hypothetical protein